MSESLHLNRPDCAYQVERQRNVEQQEYCGIHFRLWSSRTNDRGSRHEGASLDDPNNIGYSPAFSVPI